MLPAAPILDGMGFHGLETWGGATIDSCLRFLNENPFDRLRTLKKAAPENAPPHASARAEHRAVHQFPRRRGRGLRQAAPATRAWTFSASSTP
jgi:hypothetical protein